MSRWPILGEPALGPYVGLQLRPVSRISNAKGSFLAQIYTPFPISVQCGIKGYQDLALLHQSLAIATFSRIDYQRPLTKWDPSAVCAQSSFSMPFQILILTAFPNKPAGANVRIGVVYLGT